MLTKTVLLIPLLILRNIPVPRRCIFFVYLVGGISIVAAVMRYVFIYRYMSARNDREAIALHQANELWNSIEYCTASIAFCLPALRNLFRKKLCSPIPPPPPPMGADSGLSMISPVMGDIEANVAPLSYGVASFVHVGRGSDDCDMESWTWRLGQSDVGDSRETVSIATRLAPRPC